MEFKKLEAFVNVVKYSSFSKAAEATFLSQPSISAYVTALEKEFGTQLLFRSTKEVFPTKAGKIVYEYAKSVLALKVNIVSEIQNLSETHRGELELIASSVPSQSVLPHIIGAFSKLYPNITYKLTQANSKEVVNEILSQAFELGVVGSVTDEPKCFFEPFYLDKLVIITPYQKKYLQIPANISPDFILSESFILREQGSGTLNIFANYLNSIGIAIEQLKYIARFNSTEAIIRAVSSGLGISVVSKATVQAYADQKLVHVIEPEALELTRRFYFVYRKNLKLSLITKLFLDFAKTN